MDMRALFLHEEALREKSGLCRCGKPMDNTYGFGHCNKCLEAQESKENRKQHEADLY